MTASFPTHVRPVPDTTPFSRLDPETLLAAVETTGMRPDGRLLALNSYENRVYQIGLDDDEMCVAKFYRPERWSDAAIGEEHEFVTRLAARELPVVAPLNIAGTTLHHHEGLRFALFPLIGGRAPELDAPGTLIRMGRFLARIHAIGALEAYEARPALDVNTFGTEPRQWLLENDIIPGDLLPAWESVTHQALEGVRQCYARAGDVALIRLHGDCHAGNIMWNEAAPIPGPHFVDFDDSRSGPAIQDLWMLLSGSRDEMALQLREVLAGYDEFYDFDARELHLIEALRTLRLIHYAGWLARRWEDPAFPAAFPWFGTQHYWQEHILALREQIALMDEAPPALHI